MNPYFRCLQRIKLDYVFNAQYKTLPWHSNDDQSEYTFFYPDHINELDFMTMPQIVIQTKLIFYKGCSYCFIGIPSSQSCFIVFFRIKNCAARFHLQIYILTLFRRKGLDGEINVKLPLQNKITRSRAELGRQYANINRGERSLLNTSVNL